MVGPNELFVVVFIDDILVYFRSDVEHEEDLRIELQLLWEKLYDKLKMYAFWLREIAFLGHVISAAGVAVDQKKVETVTPWDRIAIRARKQIYHPYENPRIGEASNLQKIESTN